jgi:hypothetical protein
LGPKASMKSRETPLTGPCPHVREMYIIIGYNPIITLSAGVMTYISRLPCGSCHIMYY